jgi:hypothetical protein
MPQSTDLLQGTLDLLVMQTVALKPMHGWMGRCAADSTAVTPKGKKQLEAELATLDRLFSAIGSVRGRVAEAS